MRNYKISYWHSERLCITVWIGEAPEIHEAISKFCDELDILSQMITQIEVITL